MEEIKIQYCFQLPDKRQEVFDIVLDKKSMEAIDAHPSPSPEWSRLEFHQCPNCPWLEDERPWCPVAVKLASIVNKFENILSYDEIDLEVHTRERVVFQNTSAQRGIASYMGLVMATSGCPHTLFLKPMARFHLPLASEEETIYRAFSMHALAHYFLQPGNLDCKQQFDSLKDHYSALQTVNVAIAKRLKAACSTDSSVNALINLDMYAKAMPYVIEESLEELRYLFTPEQGE
ncbi:MAG: hypothetical protein H8E41_00265 [Desulfobulbaceae bacterium]|uniref:Uncharacterized protein n=1 Tax=Candidatus Desulfobia pelagia TaxID=2841692 RepID=A0A8J6TEE0_9BACT|nr:hypothetical protein [Candidatus Desulfobia pelagia]